MHRLKHASHVLLAPVFDFLGAVTPQAWLSVAVDQMAILLIDHAHCEKKAAANALNLMFRYVDKPDVLRKMSQLAREELLHFEQVMGLLQTHHIEYTHLKPSQYASGLKKHVRHHEPDRLVDALIMGAFIEARSCERFAALATCVPYPEIAQYYEFLLKSESRHFEDYLALAQANSVTPIDERIHFFREIEANLITSPDSIFRFHSGVPRVALDV